MKLDFIPTNTEDFFEQLFHRPSKALSCLFDTFVSITEDMNIDYVTIYTTCPELTISGFAFPSRILEHKIYLSGLSSPIITEPSLEGASVITLSNLTEGNIILNQFISLQQFQYGSDIVAGYWHNGSFKAILNNVAFSLFESFFTAPVNINPDGLKFESDVFLFGTFDAHITGQVAQGHSWDGNFSLNIDGNFKTGPNTFVFSLEQYIYNYTKTKVSMSQERIANAQINIANTELLLQQYNTTIASKLSNVDKLSNVEANALAKVDVSAAAVEQAQAILNSVNATVQVALAKVLAVCEDIPCSNMCLPMAMYVSCDNHLTLEEWGFSDVITIDEVLQHKMDFITEEIWHIERLCRIITNIKGWAETTFSQICSYRTISSNVTYKAQVTYNNVINVSHIQPVVIDSHTITVTQLCSQEDPCGSEIFDYVCALTNAGCHVAQQPAIDALNEAEKALIGPLLQLNQAKLNLSLAQGELAVVNSMKTIAEQSYYQALQAYQTIENQLVLDQEYLASILIEESPFIELAKYLESNTIEQLLQFSGISFSITIEVTSPQSFPVTILCRLPLFDTSFSVDLSPNFSATLPILQRDISNAVLTELGHQLEEIGGIKKRSIHHLPFNQQQFEEKCASLKDVKKFLTQINQSIEFVLLRSNDAKQNISLVAMKMKDMLSVDSLNFTNINFTFLQEELLYTIGMDELLLLAKAKPEIVSLTATITEIQEFTKSLTLSIDDDLFTFWIIGFMSVFNPSGFQSVGNHQCYGLTDCLTITSTIIQELVEDAPIAMQEKLLSEFPLAKEKLYTISLETNLTMSQALSLTSGMYSIAQQLEATNYWCNGPPTMTKHPIETLHVEYGDNFNITCAAESTLPIHYLWKKDGFTLPTFNTNILYINSTTLLDEGQYQCTASNPVGTVESKLARVQVYIPPIITLSPSNYETFEGSDNGGWFACNATGHPTPGYEWYFSSNNQTWSLIEVSGSNELVVHKPNKSQEGWYKCRVFLGDSEDFSKIAHLTVYGASVSTLVFPIDFIMIVLHHHPQVTANYTDGVIDNLLNELKSYVNKDYVKFEDVKVVFGYNNATALVDLIFSSYYEYSLSVLISDQADTAFHYKDNLFNGLIQLETGLKTSTLHFNYEDSLYVTVGLSLIVENLKYQCPSGQELKYGNFMCSKCYYM